MNGYKSSNKPMMLVEMTIATTKAMAEVARIIIIIVRMTINKISTMMTNIILKITTKKVLVTIAISAKTNNNNDNHVMVIMEMIAMTIK